MHASEITDIIVLICDNNSNEKKRKEDAAQMPKERIQKIKRYVEKSICSYITHHSCTSFMYMYSWN